MSNPNREDGRQEGQRNATNNQSKSIWQSVRVSFFCFLRCAWFAIPGLLAVALPSKPVYLCGRTGAAEEPPSGAAPCLLFLVLSTFLLCCDRSSSFWVGKTLLGGHKSTYTKPSSIPTIPKASTPLLPSPWNPSHRRPVKGPSDHRMFLHRPPSPRLCRYQSVMCTISRHTVVVASLPMQPFLPRPFTSLPVPP